MSNEPIDLAAFRQKKVPQGMPDPSPLFEAAALIAQYADEVTRQSVEQHGAIDIVAMQLCVRHDDIKRVADEIAEANNR